MKTEVVQKVPTFAPIKITLTLESLDEAAALYAMFNHGLILDAVEPAISRSAANEIRSAINGACSGFKPDTMKYHQRLISACT